MRWILSASAIVILLFQLFVFSAGRLAGQTPATAPEVDVRFRAVDLFVDSGERPLAAYQLDFSATSAQVKIVSIEGGEHPAFKEPPYYDPLAIQRERAILGAFNTASADQLPRGKTRVATVHVQIRGESRTQFKLRLATAATSDGQPIPVQTSIQERSAP